MRGTREIHAALRRWPDLESPEATAADSADRLLLDEAAPELAALDGAARGLGGDTGGVVVIGDHYGGIALPLLVSGAVGHLRASTDSLLGERAANANRDRLGCPPQALTHLPLGSELLSGARLVLLRLPRGLEELREIAQNIAVHARPEVRVVAAGRTKHMTRAMNDVLAENFREVRASLGRQKARALHASGVREPVGSVTFPVPGRIHEPLLGLDLEVLAHGGAFAGARLDVGTRALVRHLGEMAPDAREVVDLGCGTGVLACALARARGQVRVTAIDISAAAVASARATAAANGLADRVRVLRADGLREVARDSVDLIVCNPPMHTAAALRPQVGLRLLSNAGRVLRPDGELWTVYNSRLGHSGALRRMVGPSQVIHDDGRFTVTRTRLRSGAID